jgi:hypothetical protein
VHDVEVRLKEGLDDSLTRVEANGDRAEDAGEGNAVAGLDEVDEFVIEAERDGVRGLAIGDGICERYGSITSREQEECVCARARSEAKDLPGVSWRRTI